MRDFRNSDEQAYRRLIRQHVRSGPFTKSERDVVMALVNLWFHWRAKGSIQPARATLAKKADVSVKTVSRALDALRAAGVLTTVSGGSGGRSKATEYRLSEYRLLEFCGADLEEIFAQLAPVNRDKCPGIEHQKTGTKCPAHIERVYTVEDGFDAEGGKVVHLTSRKAGGHV